MGQGSRRIGKNSCRKLLTTLKDDFLGQYALSFAHDSIEMDGSDINVALVPRKKKEKVKGTLTFSLSYKRVYIHFTRH